MDPMTWLYIASTASKLIGDQQRNASDKKVRAAEILASPWKSIENPTQIRTANPLGTIATGISEYMQQGQANEAAAAEKAMREKMFNSQIRINDALAQRLAPEAPIAPPDLLPKAPPVEGPSRAPASVPVPRMLQPYLFPHEMQRMFQSPWMQMPGIPMDVTRTSRYSG